MHAPIHTWLDGHLALRHHAFEMRGSIVLSTGERWPRTTGSEVMVIAAAFDPVVRAHALPLLLRRWCATLADLQRDGRPWLHHIYAGNRGFWSTLDAVSIFLDDLAIRPPGQHAWDSLLDVIGTGPRNVGPRGDGPFKQFDGIRTLTSSTTRSTSICSSCAASTSWIRRRSTRARTARSERRRRSRARRTRTCSHSPAIGASNFKT